MITIEIKVVDTGKFKKKLDQFIEEVKKRAADTVNKAATVYHEQVMNAITLSPHGDVFAPYDAPFGHFHVLGKTRDSGGYEHPFSRRWASIQSHDHSPDYGIHMVSETMSSLCTLSFNEDKGEYWSYTASVGWNPAIVDATAPPYNDNTSYISDVLQGTSIMHERPVLRYVAESINLKDNFKNMLVQSLSEIGKVREVR